MTGSQQRWPVVLAVGGSDSCGGAGLQADVKTLAAFGVHGAVAVTAVTAQNTAAIDAIHVLPAALVRAQMEAVLAEMQVDVIKTGMLATGELLATVADVLRGNPGLRLVVDPIVRSTSGRLLLEEAALPDLVNRLLPLATLVTPNLAEAALLAGGPVSGPEEAARRIVDGGAAAVLITAGHGGDDVLTDLMYDGERFTRFRHRRLPGGPVHGTGCALSAAVAALLASGQGLEEAVMGATEYMQAALQEARSLGGPQRLLGNAELFRRRP